MHALTVLRRDAFVHLAIAWLGLIGLMMLARGLPVSARALAQMAGVMALISVLLWRWLPDHRPHERFGAANTVTLWRGVLVAGLAGLIGEPIAQWPWLAVGVALVSLLLDGVDGYLARRYATASRFGGRFDMETDALLILVLCVLVWQMGNAGAWIVLAGLMRYAFIAAGWCWSALSAPLPPSKRRQTVCVLQIVALLVCLSPLLTRPTATVVAALSLVILGGSFGKDILWLLGRSPPHEEEEYSR